MMWSSLDDLTAEKRAYEGAVEEDGYWQEAAALRAEIGDMAVRRLLALVPEESRRTGHALSRTLDGEVRRALVRRGLAERHHGATRLTYAGGYVLQYLYWQLHGLDIGGRPIGH